ncbi:hypothetical protein F5Y12DRAFT_406789 [Xylaria sp. FL1777]|nr:hypothetical protein F5Y12DRAFT_406789 [Xylaria sp. FL1777]
MTLDILLKLLGFFFSLLSRFLYHLLGLNQLSRKTLLLFILEYFITDASSVVLYNIRKISPFITYHNHGNPFERPQQDPQAAPGPKGQGRTGRPHLWRLEGRGVHHLVRQEVGSGYLGMVTDWVYVFLLFPILVHPGIMGSMRRCREVDDAGGRTERVVLVLRFRRCDITRGAGD